MKFAYKFNNLLGSIYKRGNLIFSPDGNSVISPVGNRIAIYNLKSNESSTLPIESRFNYTTLALSPNGCTLIAINEEGEAHMISLISKTVVHRYRFKRPVHAVQFSPDGKYFAACKENTVFVFKAPGQFSGEYNAFVLERVYHNANDETTCLDWSFDSKILAVGSKDMNTRFYTLQKFTNLKSYSVSGHTDRIVACFFEKDSYDFITVSRNGQACVWECSIDPSTLVLTNDEPPIKKERTTDSDSEDDINITVPGVVTEESVTETITESKRVGKFLYRRLFRHYLADAMKKDNRDAVLSSAAYHQQTKILVTGFSTGAFVLHEMPELNLIHSLSISDQIIGSISINLTGDWIALGCSGIGQLLVWEWQSETYVMKQQGHANNISCIAYSADGQYLASGGQDGKLKIWNMQSGFCFITFNEHTAPITGVTFSFNKKCILSASLDGTVRAYDINRYRNFRTFTTPRPVQLSCVAVDYSGELVAAGGQDVFEIFVWSVKLGKLLDILSGHEGPVCSVAFSPSPTSTALASVSWDKTVRLWNALENGSKHETIELQSDALYVAFKPNGEEIAVATLDGQISVFQVKTSTQLSNIEGRNDLGAGRADSDLVTAKQILKARAFTSLCYSADGECLLAGGHSKNVCIYNVKEGLLIKKFEITQNRSLDAVDTFINRRKMSEFGNIALVEEREQLEGGSVAIKLPGSKANDAGSRIIKPEIRVFDLQFSPSGEAWAAATTEGLLIYSLNQDLVFDPWGPGLDESITPASIRNAAANNEHSKALMMSLRLNEQAIIKEIIEGIPPDQIDLTVSSLSEIYSQRLLNFVTINLKPSRHLEFYLTWSLALIAQNRKAKIAPTILLGAQQAIQRKYDQLSKICDFNKYTLNVVSQLASNVYRKNMKSSDSLKMSCSEDESS